jgi:hypothetical protein
VFGFLRTLLHLLVVDGYVNELICILSNPCRSSIILGDEHCASLGIFFVFLKSVGLHDALLS